MNSTFTTGIYNWITTIFQWAWKMVLGRLLSSGFFFCSGVSCCFSREVGCSTSMATRIRRWNWSGCSGLVFTCWYDGFGGCRGGWRFYHFLPVRSARIGIHLSAYQLLEATILSMNLFIIRIAHHERNSYQQNAWDFPSSKHLQDPKIGETQEVCMCQRSTHTWNSDKHSKL